jgi:hypothetical protein
MNNIAEIEQEVTDILKSAETASEHRYALLDCRYVFEAIIKDLNRRYFGKPSKRHKKNLEKLKNQKFISENIYDEMLRIHKKSSYFCHNNQISGNIQNIQKFRDRTIRLCKTVFKDIYDVNIHTKGLVDPESISKIYKQSEAEAEAYLKEVQSTPLEINHDDCCELYTLAERCELQGNYFEAEKFCQMALNGFKKLHSEEGIAESMLLLGTILELQDRLLEANNVLLECLNVAEASGSMPIIGGCLQILGIIDEKRAKRMLISQSGTEEQISALLDDAAMYFQGGLDAMVNCNNSLGIAHLQSSLATHFLTRIGVDKVENKTAVQTMCNLYRDSIKRFEHLGQDRHQATSSFMLGQLLNLRSKSSLFSRRKYRKEAGGLLSFAVSTFEEFGDIQKVNEINKLLENL